MLESATNHCSHIVPPIIAGEKSTYEIAPSWDESDDDCPRILFPEQEKGEEAIATESFDEFKPIEIDHGGHRMAIYRARLPMLLRVLIFIGQLILIHGSVFWLVNMLRPYDYGKSSVTYDLVIYGATPSGKKMVLNRSCNEQTTES